MGLYSWLGTPSVFMAGDCLLITAPALSKENCAQQICNYMPLPLINLINGPDWKGGALLDLPESQGIKTPTAREVSRNYSFVKPVIMCCPEKVNVCQNCF